MDKNIRKKIMIILASLPISCKKEVMLTDLKSIRPEYITPKNENKTHFRDLEKKHSKKSKRLYNQGYR